MTLNAVIAFILRFFHRIWHIIRPIISLWLKRPIMSVKYCLPAPVFYFWRKLLRTLQRGLSAIAEHLFMGSCFFLCCGTTCLNSAHSDTTAKCARPIPLVIIRHSAAECTISACALMLNKCSFVWLMVLWTTHERSRVGKCLKHDREKRY